jgi:DNA-binding response OmpR family regulator
VVDDEPTLVQTIAYNLRREGFDVLTANDGQEALRKARDDEPDFIILDLMLPGIDGLEVCRRLRRESNVPILMLTAKDSELDRVVGLELGADDYVVKPFSMRELVARVKAGLRRAQFLQDEAKQVEPPSVMVSGDLRIDLARRQVTLADRVLALKPKEFDLLAYLLQNKGLALTRQQILERVWGYDYLGDSRTVDVHIRWLRAKLDDVSGGAQRITTLRHVGYRFEG